MENSLYCYKARCLNVVDGDTIDVELSLGFNVYVRERIRLAGINTSEIYGVKKNSEEYKKGMLSTMRAKQLMLGKDLIVKTTKDKKGKYGRYIASVFVDGIDVGDTLIKEGLAKEVKY